MIRNFFPKERTFFKICVIVDWSTGSPEPILLPSVEEYASFLPKLKKENLQTVCVEFLLHNFAEESWIREVSMDINPLDGLRFLNGAKFRENKLRYLLRKWNLTDDQGVIVPLQLQTAEGRPGLSEDALQKVRSLNSNLVFSLIAQADRVLAGLVPPEDLFTEEDFKQLIEGKVPAKFQQKEESNHPKA